MRSIALILVALAQSAAPMAAAVAFKLSTLQLTEQWQRFFLCLLELTHVHLLRLYIPVSSHSYKKRCERPVYRSPVMNLGHCTDQPEDIQQTVEAMVRRYMAGDSLPLPSGTLPTFPCMHQA